MPNWKYVLGLLLIILIVWLTMILCLKVIYPLLISIGLPTTTSSYINTLIMDAIKLLLAGFAILVWLYSWNMLVKVYFQRNLSQSETKQKRPSGRRKKGITRVGHIPRKSSS